MLGIHNQDKLCGKDCAEVCTVETAKTLEELDKMRESWIGFNTSSAETEDIELFKLVLTTRPDILRPHVMCMLSAGVPQAIMAGRLEQSRLEYKFGYKTIWRQNVRILAIPQGGFMGDVSKKNAERFLEEYLMVIKRGDADVIYFQGVVLESPLCDAIKTLVPFYLREYVMNPSPRWSLRLPQNIDIMYKKMSSKGRTKMRKKFKFIEQEFPGKISYKIFGEPKDIDVLCRDIEFIAMKTYQRSLGVGFIDNEENRKRLSLYADKEKLFTILLYIDCKPCAFHVGYIQNNIFYSYFTGFDPAYNKYDPGTLTLMRMIEELITRHVEIIDFGFGDATYKHRFGAEFRLETSFYIFRPSIKWVSVNLLRNCIALSRSLAIFLLTKIGVAQKIKTGWRRRIRSTYQK